MNKELVTNITSFAKARSFDCDLIQGSDAKAIIENLAEIFHFDLSKRYLWEEAHAKEVRSYGDENADWETQLSELLQGFKSRIYFVVTDDEFYPWVVFDCKKDRLIDILKEQQYFEYFVFDASMKQVLFDTHENKLLLASRRTHLQI